MRFRNSSVQKRKFWRGKSNKTNLRHNRHSDVKQISIGRNTHGNTKNHVKHFQDSYDGQSAYLYTVWGRLKGLKIDVSPTNRDKTVGLKAEYRVSIKKDAAYYKLSASDWQDLRGKEKNIRTTANRLSLKRKNKIRSSNISSMSLADIQDFERDAPELYANLPRKQRKNIRQ